MLFNSVEFFIFLPIVILIYLLLPQKGRVYFLLAASYYFYASWSYEYLILIIFTTITSYLFGLGIGKTNSERLRKVYLFSALFINLGVLFVFKYFNFFNNAVSDVYSIFDIQYEGLMLNLLLPVGISFYTFQALSYVVDIYRGQTTVENSIIRYSLYVSFFPQLVAGPIERSYNLLPQLKIFKTLRYENVSTGFKLILWGLFTKVVIADRLALVVNSVYNDVYSYSGLSYIIATFFFTYQIYLDFSGYSNIAIGVAKFFNIDLMENFRRPYFSKTITEFWGRWHISLSTWFKDYLYIPLGGNKVSKQRWIFNIITVFVVSGLWHGANYTFLVWGGIHGVMLVLEKQIYGNKLKYIKSGVNLSNFWKWLFTYSIVILAWVFFRANTLTDALYILSHFFEISFNDFNLLFQSGGTSRLLGISIWDFLLSIFFIMLFILINFSVRKRGLVKTVELLPITIRWFIYIVVSITILWFGKFGMNEFIYFQF